MSVMKFPGSHGSIFVCNETMVLLFKFTDRSYFLTDFKFHSEYLANNLTLH